MLNFNVLPGGTAILTDVIKDAGGDVLDPAALSGPVVWSADTGAFGNGSPSGVNQSVFTFVSTGFLGNPPALGVTTITAQAPGLPPAVCSVTVVDGPPASEEITGVVIPPA